MRNIIKTKTLTDAQIRKYFLDHYYSDNNNTLPWEPFNDYSKKQINEFIENDTYMLKHLLGIKTKVTF